MFHGAQEFLLHRIINKMPPSFRRLVDNVEVVTRPKVAWYIYYIFIAQGKLARLQWFIFAILPCMPIVALMSETHNKMYTVHSEKRGKKNAIHSFHNIL